MPLESALWSLERAVSDWLRAVEIALEESVVFIHPERGEQTVLDVSRSNAHDAYHHEWDTRRSIE